MTFPAVSPKDEATAPVIERSNDAPTVILRSEAITSVILRSEATKNLLRLLRQGRSFAALRMTKRTGGSR
jgi:hypothetical protein